MEGQAEMLLGRGKEGCWCRSDPAHAVIPSAWEWMCWDLCYPHQQRRIRTRCSLKAKILSLCSENLCPMKTPPTEPPYPTGSPKTPNPETSVPPKCPQHQRFHPQLPPPHGSLLQLLPPDFGHSTAKLGWGTPTEDAQKEQQQKRKSQINTFHPEWPILPVSNEECGAQTAA